MVKNIKPGDTISCIVENLINKCILVRFEYDNHEVDEKVYFRGVLVDAKKPCTKQRAARFQFANQKPQLTDEITQSFVDVFNATHISGKHLRNRNKPSCLVLDDYRHGVQSNSATPLKIIDEEQISQSEDSPLLSTDNQQKDSFLNTEINTSELMGHETTSRKTNVTFEMNNKSECEKKKLRDSEKKNTTTQLKKSMRLLQKKLLNSCELDGQATRQGTSALGMRQQKLYSKNIKDEINKKKSNKAQSQDLCQSRIHKICQHLKNCKLREDRSLRRKGSFQGSRRFQKSNVKIKGAMKRKMNKLLKHVIKSSVNDSKHSTVEADIVPNIQSEQSEQRIFVDTKNEFPVYKCETGMISPDSEKLPPVINISKRFPSSQSEFIRLQTDIEKQQTEKDKRGLPEMVGESNMVFAPLLCHEPPLKDTFSDEEDEKFYRSRQASLRKRKKVQKILKGHVSRLPSSHAIPRIPAVHLASTGNSGKPIFLGLKYNNATSKITMPLSMIFCDKNSILSSQLSKNPNNYTRHLNITCLTGTDSDVRQQETFVNRTNVENFHNTISTAFVSNDASNDKLVRNEICLQHKATASTGAKRNDQSSTTYVTKNEKVDDSIKDEGVKFTSNQKNDSICLDENPVALEIFQSTNSDMNNVQLCEDAIKSTIVKSPCRDNHGEPSLPNDSNEASKKFIKLQEVQVSDIVSQRQILEGNVPVDRSQENQLSKVYTNDLESQYPLSGKEMKQKNSVSNIYEQENVSTNIGQRNDPCQQPVSNENRDFVIDVLDDEIQSKSTKNSSEKDNSHKNKDCVDLESFLYFDPSEYSRISFQRLIQSAKSERMKKILEKIPEGNKDQQFNKSDTTLKAAEPGGSSNDSRPPGLRAMEPEGSDGVSLKKTNAPSEEDTSSISCNHTGDESVTNGASKCDKKDNEKFANGSNAVKIAVDVHRRSKKNVKTEQFCCKNLASKDFVLRIALRNVSKSNKNTKNSDKGRKRSQSLFRTRISKVKSSWETFSGLTNIENAMHWFDAQQHHKKDDFDTHKHLKHNKRPRLKGKEQKHELIESDKNKQKAADCEIDLHCYEKIFRSDISNRSIGCDKTMRCSGPSISKASIESIRAFSDNFCDNFENHDCHKSNFSNPVEECPKSADKILLSGSLRFEKQYKKPCTKQKGKSARGRSRSIRLRNLECYSSFVPAKQPRRGDYSHDDNGVQKTFRFSESACSNPGSSSTVVRSFDNCQGNVGTINTFSNQFTIDEKCGVSSLESASTNSSNETLIVSSKDESLNKEGLPKADVYKHMRNKEQSRKNLTLPDVYIREEQVHKITRYPRHFRRTSQDLQMNAGFRNELSLVSAAAYKITTNNENLCSIQQERAEPFAFSNLGAPSTSLTTKDVAKDVSCDATQQLLNEMLELNKNLLAHKKDSINKTDNL